MGQPLSSRTGKAGAQRRGVKRGPSSWLHQQIDAIVQLPKAKQRFVSQMLGTVLAQATRWSSATASASPAIFCSSSTLPRRPR